MVSGQRSAREITEIADKRIKRALETVKDVGAITLVGDRKREIQILVNPDKLTAFNLSIQQVKDALLRQNVEIPGGGSPRAATRKACARAASSRSRRSTTSSWPTSKGSPVRARRRHGGGRGGGAAHALAPQRRQRGVLLIRKQSGTNTVAVVDRVKARLAEVQKGLPQDIQFEIVRDLSRFIKRSFHEVQDHLLLGGLSPASSWPPSSAGCSGTRAVLVAIIGAVARPSSRATPSFSSR